MLLLVGVVGALGVRRHNRLEADADKREARLRAGPQVLVTTARRSPAEHTLPLQAEVRPFASATLSAKVSGYLRELRVDTGSGPEVFVEASPTLRSPQEVELPAEALVLRGDKTLVAVLTPEKKIHFQEVKVGYEDGQTVRLLAGLAAGGGQPRRCGCRGQRGPSGRVGRAGRRGQRASGPRRSSRAQALSSRDLHALAVCVVPQALPATTAQPGPRRNGRHRTSSPPL